MEILAVKQRLACDRCSHHKLRCNKRTDSDICLRCQAANVECIFSPSRRGCRPAQKRRQEQNQAAEDSIVLDSNLFPPASTTPWEPSLLSPQLDSIFFDTSLAPVTHLTSIDIESVPSPTTSSPCLTLDRNLASLSHKLSEHLATIPPLSVWSVPPGELPRDLQIEPDGTFAVTQSLIDLYRDTSLIQASKALNDSTIYMLIACHHRVLDIWDRMFIHAHKCVAHASHVGPVNVPPINIGSFRPSGSASISLYATLIIHLAQQLHSGILTLIAKLPRHAMTSTDLYTSDGPLDELARIDTTSNPRNATILSCQAVVDRAAKMLAGIETIRASIPESVLQN